MLTMEDLGICKGQGNLLCSMRVGSDQVQLSKNGKDFYTLFNGRVIAAYKSDKDLIAKGLPFVLPVIKEMCKKAGMDEMRWLPTTSPKKDNKMISDAMKYVKDNLKPAEIFVLELVPDEIQDQLPKQASKKSVLSGLQDYRDSLKEFETTVNGLRGTSGILLKTCLAKQMWGSKSIMDIITANKAAMVDISPDTERVDMCFERSGDRARFIQAAFERKMSTQQVKEVVGKIIEEFSFLKTYMSRMAQELQPLYTIDREFKAKVGYPATWFFNPSTFMDFTDGYESLIKHIIKSASLETEVFEPLLVWKITGVA